MSRAFTVTGDEKWEEFVNKDLHLGQLQHSALMPSWGQHVNVFHHSCSDTIWPAPHGVHDIPGLKSIICVVWKRQTHGPPTPTPSSILPLTSESCYLCIFRVTQEAGINLNSFSSSSSSSRSSSRFWTCGWCQGSSSCMKLLLLRPPWSNLHKQCRQWQEK